MPESDQNVSSPGLMVALALKINGVSVTVLASFRVDFTWFFHAQKKRCGS